MDKLVGLLGLCRRSGNLVFGNDAVAGAVKANKAKLVLLSSDAGSNIISQINYICEPFVVALSSDEMGYSIGRPKTAVVAIIDNNFAKAILKLIK